MSSSFSTQSESGNIVDELQSLFQSLQVSELEGVRQAARELNKTPEQLLNRLRDKIDELRTENEEKWALGERPRQYLVYKDAMRQLGEEERKLWQR
jgi:predicted transcriptional regulator